MRPSAGDDAGRQERAVKPVADVIHVPVPGTLEHGRRGEVDGHLVAEGTPVRVRVADAVRAAKLLGNPQPNLNMNGHTLTIEGGFCFGNSSSANSATLSNPGDIVLLANARLLLASMASLTVNGTGAATWPALNGKTITLNDGAQMMHYMLRDAPTATWKVVVPEGAAARFNLHGNNDKTRAYVYNPFEVDGTLYLHENDGSIFSARLLSEMTGGGKVICESKQGKSRAKAEGVMRFRTRSWTRTNATSARRGSTRTPRPGGRSPG